MRMKLMTTVLLNMTLNVCQLTWSRMEGQQELLMQKEIPFCAHAEQRRPPARSSTRYRSSPVQCPQVLTVPYCSVSDGRGPVVTTGTATQ